MPPIKNMTGNNNSLSYYTKALRQVQEKNDLNQCEVILNKKRAVADLCGSPFIVISSEN